MNARSIIEEVRRIRDKLARETAANPADYFAKPGETASAGEKAARKDDLSAEELRLLAAEWDRPRTPKTVLALNDKAPSDAAMATLEQIMGDVTRLSRVDQEILFDWLTQVLARDLRLNDEIISKGEPAVTDDVAAHLRDIESAAARKQWLETFFSGKDPIHAFSFGAKPSQSPPRSRGASS